MTKRTTFAQTQEVAGRDFDEAGTRAAFGAMDLNKDGAVSFYEYSTVQLKLIAPEEYGPTVKMLTRVLKEVASRREQLAVEKERARQDARAKAAAAFNYRLERILSAHGGVAAVTGSVGTADGVHTAVRSWADRGRPGEGGHWSGGAAQLSPMRGTAQVAGSSPWASTRRKIKRRRKKCDVDAEDDWGAVERRGEQEVEEEERLLEQDSQDSDDGSEEELTFEEYCEVAEEAALEEGGSGEGLDLGALRVFFDAVDTDRSGTITLSEIAEHQREKERRERNWQLEAFRSDLQAVEQREQQEEDEQLREGRELQEEEGRWAEEEAAMVSTQPRVFTLRLAGSATPRLAFGERGGLIAVVAPPLGNEALQAGVMVGDEVLKVDGVRISRNRNETAARHRLLALSSRSSLSWVFRRNATRLPAEPLSPLSVAAPPSATEEEEEETDATIARAAKAAAAEASDHAAASKQAAAAAKQALAAAAAATKRAEEEVAAAAEEAARAKDAASRCRKREAEVPKGMLLSSRSAWRK